MRESETVVIVGAGLAGHSAAETLRAEGFAGRIVLLGEEERPPYDRPPLSKEFLAGAWDEERLFYRAPSAYAAQGIDLRLGARAEGLDTAAGLVVVAGSDPIPYDHLLLAMGGYPRRLAVPGSDLPGIHYLRTIDDAEALGRHLGRGERLLVVGAGFIGCEVAASARSRGVDVTVLEALSLPMGAVFGPEIGAFFAAEHLARGVDLRCEEAVSEFVGAERLEGVVSSRGLEYGCTCAVVGVGLTPATEILAATPISVADGVLVDEFCRSSVPNVYAAGDVARWWHPALGRSVRLEHWENAAKQATVAARNILGRGEVYSPVPYFWSDQFDLKLQLFGFVPKDGRVEVVMRGRHADRAFVVFYLVDGRLAAVASVNRFREARLAARLIGRAAVADPEFLADPAADLAGLVKRLDAS